MTTLTVPLVGSFFRKPAPAIISNLPSGCPLSLIAEPDNPHSKNGMAIKVVVRAGDVARGEEIEAACAAQGTFPNDLYGNDWHLGYVAEATGENAILYPRLEEVESATLAFDFKGKPQVKVKFMEVAETVAVAEADITY